VRGAEGGELPQSGGPSSISPCASIATRLADLIALCDAADAGQLVHSGEGFSFARKCVDEIAQASFVICAVTYAVGHELARDIAES